MNSYEAKQEARRERLKAAADRATARSNEAYRRADLREEVSGIPLGQPIIIGSASEGKHRAAIRRAENAMRRSIAEGKRADELRAKAAGVGKAGISSDDPEAVEKLREKIASAEAAQERMKQLNKIVKAALKAGVTADSTAKELAPWIERGAEGATPGWGEGAMRKLLTPDFCGRYGFPSYSLTNNNANIRRIKQRLEQLERTRNRESKNYEFDGLRVAENIEDNRVQFLFDGKPAAEVRAILKQQGFRWAPSVGAWQRQLTPAGVRGGREAIRLLKLMGKI